MSNFLHFLECLTTAPRKGLHVFSSGLLVGEESDGNEEVWNPCWESKTHVQYLKCNMTVASGSVKSDLPDSFTLCFSFYNVKIVRIERIFHFSGTQQLNLTSVVKVKNISKIRPRRYWSSNILPWNYIEYINPLSGCIRTDKLTSQNEN